MSSKLADVVEEATENNENTSLLHKQKDYAKSTSSSRLRALQSFLQISESDRLEALEHAGVGQAAFLIRDAVLGLVENPAEGAYDPSLHPESPQLNAISIVCRRLCSMRFLRRFMTGVMSVLVLLTFFEPPNWCRYMIREGEIITDEEAVLLTGRCQELMTVTGQPAAYGADGADADVVQYYPNTSTMYLTVHGSQIVESICLFLIWTFWLLQMGRDGLSLTRFFRKGPARTVRYIGSISLFCLTVGLLYDIFTAMDKTRYFAPYLRMLVYIAANRELMREFKTLFLMMPEVGNVLFLLILFMAFYAWIGVVAFFGSPEGSEQFPNLIDAMFTLWIATTTANYPDLMMPVYNVNRFSTIYFVIYMAVTFFFMMNVILGSVVNAYDNELDQRRVERQQIADHKLAQAYELMDPDKKGSIEKETIMALFLILNKDFPEFRTIPVDEAKLLFAILDKDGTGLIDKDEFLDFGNVLLLQFEEIHLQKNLVARCFPRLYESQGYKQFALFIQSSLFETGIDVVLVLNAVVVFIQSYSMIIGDDVDLNPSIQDGSIDTVWEILESVFTCVYVVEISVKILVNGWHDFSQSNRNLFDMTVTILAVLATAYVYYPNEFSDSRLIRLVVMARVLRLARLLVLLTPFQMIAKIGMDVFARARVILLLLLCVCYVFSALGVQIFGGMITRDPKDPRSFLLLDSEFADNDYWANNFNDMFGSMNVLFNLLVVNNWTECQDGFEKATQARYNRLFFIFFHIVAVILVNNLVVAFVINAFIKQWDFRRERLKTQVIGGEAVIIGRSAMFNATTVTGTESGVTGTYVAKLGRRALFDEQDQQKVLKHMFTHSESTDSKKTNA